MATTKKKTTAKKAPVTKKTVAKSSKPKAARPSKTKSKQSKSAKLIGLQPERESFLTFRINRETVYWAVLGLIVILFTVWLMKLQSDIQSLYDQIDSSSAVVESL